LNFILVLAREKFFKYPGESEFTLELSLSAPVRSLIYLFFLYCTYWQLGNLTNKQLVYFSCNLIRKKQEKENMFYYPRFLLPFLSYIALVLTHGR